MNRTTHQPDVVCLVMAAGMSKRAGSPKQLLIVNAKPILQHVIDLAKGVDASKVVVVLGFQAARIQREINLAGCHTVIAEHFASGLAASLSEGLKRIEDSANKVLVMLGDQPYVKAATVEQLLSAHHGSKFPLTVPVFHGTKGAPFVADIEFLRELLDNQKLLIQFKMFEGDEGAQLFFNYFRNSTLEVTTDDDGVIRDVDYLSDATNL